MSDYLSCLRDGSTPGEVKHLSTQRKRNRIDSVSSGERKRSSLNLFLIAILEKGVIGMIRLNFKYWNLPSKSVFKTQKKLQIRRLAERPWNSRPKKVKAL